MPVTVLVATPHRAFGELLKISLLDSAPYQIDVAPSAQAARERFSDPDRPPYDLAIFDSALVDEPFTRLCRDLLERQPGARLIVIPPDNNPNHPALGGLLPHGYLSRPFYQPDLVETVDRLLADRLLADRRSGDRRSGDRRSGDLLALSPARQYQPATSPAAADLPTTPLWLKDPDVLAGYLAAELAKTQAMAAMVVAYSNTDAPARLAAQAGSLPGAYIPALAEVTFRYWNDNEKTDLMRYVRIPQDRNDFLVYATRIPCGRAAGAGLVLVMVHNNTTPVSQIRPQTRAIAQALASLPPEGFTAPPAGTQGEALPPAGQRSAGQEVRTQPLDAQELIALLARAASAADAASGEDTAKDEGAPSEDATPAPRVEQSMISRRFAGRETPTIPGGGQPGPADEWRRPQDSGPQDSGPQESGPLSGEGGDAASPEAAWIPPHKRATEPLNPDRLSHGLPGTGGTSRTAAEMAAAFAAESADAQPRRRSAALDVKTEPPLTPAAISARSGALVFDMVHAEASIDPPDAPQDGKDTLPGASEPQEQALERSQERPLERAQDPTLQRLDQLEPVSPALSLLKYTCVVLPRMPQHFLTGDLAEKVAEWVPQVCLAYGWRLEGLSIRPEYLQWTVTVPPAISPGALARTLRQRVSYHVFGAFPSLAEQNPSGDFWALGYLIVSGGQPPSAQLLRDFIAQTRKRQGAVKS